MRKIEIENFNCLPGCTSDIMFVVENTALRREHAYYAYSKRTPSKFMSDICKNLNASDCPSFVNNKTKSLVIIDDKRQEIGCIQNRSLITTGFLYEELLQVNRGTQNIEKDRNKFFINDITGNADGFNSDYYLRVLDLCWYLQEQKANAIEISARHNRVSSKRVLPEPHNFFSKRYKKAQAETKDTLVHKIIEHITEYGDRLFEVLNKATNNNIDFSISLDSLGSGSEKGTDLGDFTDSFFEELNPFRYSYQYKYVKEYWDYRKKLLKNVSSDSDNTPITSWKEFVVDAIESATADIILPDGVSIAASSGMCELTAFGLQEFLRRADIWIKNGTVGHSPARTSYPSVNASQWKTVAESKFKRCRDWKLGNINFYKAEALKLRRNLLEGTFDE